MSHGITTYDFVQQVYYAQEKTILDFWPSDDKYKEVLFEANLILQELQNVEDWTWLRERLILGQCWHGGPGGIPEFELPDWVYKVSTLNHDSMYLHMPTHRHGGCHGHCRDWCHGSDPDMRHYITVPIASTGDNQHRKEIQDTSFGVVHMPDMRLRAIRVGNTITFNRVLFPHEARRIATIDVQRRIRQFHICDANCEFETVDGRDVCKRELDGEKHERRHLTEIPDPNYLVMATAARHAEGSPPALARVAGLQDAAQRILSAMRQNDAAATDADYQDWEIPGYIEVI